LKGESWVGVGDLGGRLGLEICGIFSAYMACYRDEYILGIWENSRIYIEYHCRVYRFGFEDDGLIE
jgi:hypothetical protein